MASVVRATADVTAQWNNKNPDANSSTHAYTPSAASATQVASECSFGSRFKIADVSAAGTFVGLAMEEADSSVMGTASQGVTSDTHIGFGNTTSSSGAIYFSVNGDGGTAITTTPVITNALEDNGWIEVAVRCRGADQYFGFVRVPGETSRWTEVASGTLPSGNTLANQMSATLATVDGTLDTDYIWFSQRRYLAV